MYYSICVCLCVCVGGKGVHYNRLSIKNEKKEDERVMQKRM